MRVPLIPGHFPLGGCCSAAGTTVGTPVAGSDDIGTPTGMFGLFLLAFATLSTPVGAPGRHLSPVKVCSQCSVAWHWLRQGSTSQSPVCGLHPVPLVHMAMQPPAARSATALPIASAVIVDAPTKVLVPPVWQAAKAVAHSRAAKGRTPGDPMFPS